MMASDVANASARIDPQPQRAQPEWNAPEGALASAPIVSVVIPAWNAAATLEETLASVAAQSWREFEVIVVDDGSQDATASLLAEQARQRCWISWCSQCHAGAAAARELGISLARGEFVAFLDADDLWVPHKLATQIAAFERNPAAAFVYADARDFFPDREQPRSLFEEKKPARGQVLRALFERGNFILTSSVVVRKAALSAVRGFDPSQRINEDVDLWWRLAERHQFDYVSEVLVRRRLLPNSLMHANPLAVWRSDLAMIDCWVQRRPDLFPANSPQVRRRRALTWSRVAHQYLRQRAFGDSRRACLRALKYGRRDPRTLARGLAACAPPAAELYWAIKASGKHGPRHAAE